MGKLQGADHKTEAELISGGGTAADLLPDTKIYVSALSINKTLDDAITDGDIGSGSGGINYISNPDAEQNATGHVAYADAAAATPVDGTGGSPNITITRSTSAPLRESASFLITKDAANRQGQGVSVDFTIDSADKNKSLMVSLDYEASSGYTGLSGTEYMVGYVLDVTNSVLIPLSNIYLPQGSGTQKVTFNSTTSTSYRLIFHIATTGTVAWTYKYDNLVVGPQEVTIGYPATSWASYTPTFTAVGTPTNVNFQWRRDGDTMLIRGNLTCGTTSLTAATITLPTGYSYPTAFVTGDYKNQWGTWTSSNSTRSHYYSSDGESGVITSDPSLATRLVFCHKGTQSGPDPDNMSNFWTSGDYVSVDIRIPIAQWANTANFSSSLVEYASNTNMASDSDDTTSFTNDPTGSQLPTVTYTANRSKRVRFKNPVVAGDTVQLQFFDFNNNSWQDWKGGGSFDLQHFENNVGYGFGTVSAVSGTTTDFDIGFGQYRRANSSSYGGTGNSWNGLDTRWKWRLVKYSNVIPVSANAKTWALSSSTGSGFTTSSTSYVDVTGLTVTMITKSDTPVKLTLQADGDATSTNEGTIRIRRNPGNTADIIIAFLRNGTIISQNSYQVSDSGLTDVFEEIPASSFQFTDTSPISGSTTYKVQAKVSNASGAADVIYTRLFAQES